MVQQIMHDPLYLAQKSAPATKADLQVGKDLQDTLKALNNLGSVSLLSGLWKPQIRF